MKKSKNLVSIVAALMALTVVCSSSGIVLAGADSTEEKRYYDVPPIATADAELETVYYTSVEQTVVRFTGGMPFYYTSDLTNACGPVAGSIIVGYYDKYIESLVPNYSTAYASGRFRGMDSTHIPALLQSLYTEMRTNVDDVGVSENDCLNGLKSYVEGKGSSLSYTSLKGTSFNETGYINSMSALEPVLFFCNSVALCEVIIADDCTDIIQIAQSTNHIMAGSGYVKLEYYNGTDNFRTDIFLEVRTGWYTGSVGYVKLEDASWIDSAYQVSIY